METWEYDSERVSRDEAEKYIYGEIGEEDYPGDTVSDEYAEWYWDFSVIEELAIKYDFWKRRSIYA